MINVKVETLQNNQYIIHIYDTINETIETIFQSYDSIIARIDKNYDLTIYEDYNYSYTTSKYLRQFLIENIWNNREYYIDLLKKAIGSYNVINKLMQKGLIIKGF